MNLTSKITLSLAFISCIYGQDVFAQQSKGKKKTNTHNAKNSLDWTGKYVSNGQTIQLFADNSYFINNGKNSNSGKLIWGSGNIITLSGSGQQLKVKESSIENPQSGEHFMKEGAIIGTGDGNSININSKLLGGKWMLIELNGKAVSVDPTDKKQPFLYFNREDGRFSGNTGCNGFGGNMKEAGDFKISFGQAMQTMMACIGKMEIEQQFTEVLRKADNYTVQNGILSLNKARMSTLARFKFVAD